MYACCLIGHVTINWAQAVVIADPSYPKKDRSSR